MHGRVEQHVDLDAAARTAAGAADAPGSSTPVYRLATEVPENWVPLFAQRQATPDGSLRLVRAAMLRPDGSNVVRRRRRDPRRPAAQTLRRGSAPRRRGVVRGYQCTRWISGRTVCGSACARAWAAAKGQAPALRRHRAVRCVYRELSLSLIVGRWTGHAPTMPPTRSCTIPVSRLASVGRTATSMDDAGTAMVNAITDRVTSSLSHDKMGTAFDAHQHVLVWNQLRTRSSSS